MAKIADMMKSGSDDRWSLYLMGGQTDDEDYHKSVFTKNTLEALMGSVGIEQVQPWTSENTDCASLPVSLNLEGVKGTSAGKTKELKLKVSALMSVPRVGWCDAYSCIFDALRIQGIPLQQFSGAFWGQCMQRGLEDAMEHDVDWVITIDYDSMFTHHHLATLMQTMAQNPGIDAISALQLRRGVDEYPLLTKADTKEHLVQGPFQVDTSHFGLTLISMDALKDVPKPWFNSQPTEGGEWGEGRIDDDIWFWHQWKKAGKTVYAHPECSIGHLQLMVSQFSDEFEAEHIHVKTWHERKGQ
jgi:hypothetical protein